MNQEEKIEIRAACPQDYDGLYELWRRTSGFGIRSVDDSRENIERFLLRNPGISAVAVCGGSIVGDILCGHDGRTGSFYHVCVDSGWRCHGICHKLVEFCSQALRREGISTVTLIAFRKNELGNAFWQNAGWTLREDINRYELSLNRSNLVEFVPDVPD